NNALIFKCKLGQYRCQIVRMSIANEVSQPRVVAGMYSRRQFVRGARHITDDCKRLFSMRTVELLFHLCKCSPDDVVMMHLGANRFDGIEPHAVNQVKVGGGE